MADRITLSEGALRLIMRGGDFKDPILQVLGSKRIKPARTETERFRLLLSDGKYVTSFAMLTTPINNQISSGELATNAIIKIKRYVTAVVNNVDKVNKHILCILEMEILVPGGKTSKIGNPEPLPEDDMEHNMDVPVTHGHLSSTSLNRSVAVASAIRHNSGDLNMSLLDHLIHPISSLSPHQNKWVIKARVSYKSAIRTCSNSRCEGMFSIDLIDESGEIRATVVKDLVDKFYDIIEVDKVYYISNCILKVANIQLTSLKNYYEMTFTNDTIVQECYDAISSIPQTQNEPFSIDKIVHIKTETLTDINEVCKTASATIQNQLTEMNLDIQKTIEGNKNISEEIKQLRAAIENREKVIESQNEKISGLQEKIENQEVKIDSLEKETRKRTLTCNRAEEKSQENKKKRRRKTRRGKGKTHVAGKQNRDI